MIIKSPGIIQAQRIARAALEQRNPLTWELAANLFRAAVLVQGINTTANLSNRTGEVTAHV